MKIVKTIQINDRFAQLEVDGNLLSIEAVLILSKKKLDDNIIDMSFIRKEIQAYDIFLKKTNRG